MISIIFLILMIGVSADSPPNDQLVYQYNEPEVSSTPIATYLATTSPTVATPEVQTEVPTVVSYVSTSYPPSISPTVLTTYQLYQSRWCEGLLRTPHPIPSDPAQLLDFEEHYVVPEYRSLWYRTCYLPYRGLGVATLWFDRSMGIANTAFRGAVQTANTALGVGQNVLRDVLGDRNRL